QYPVGYYAFGYDKFFGTSVMCPLTSFTCVRDSLVQFQALNEPALTVFDRGKRTSVSLTASGGTQALTYSVTGSYSDEIGGLALPQLEIDRFRARFNREPPDWMQRPHHLQQWAVASNITA